MDRLESSEQRKKRLAANTRRWKDKDPEHFKRLRRGWYLARRKRAMDLIGGAFCLNCGCDSIEFLEINHINGGGCLEWKDIGNKIVDCLLNDTRKPDGLNVLCALCNRLDVMIKKNPILAQRFKIRWETYTGKKAEKIS